MRSKQQAEKEEQQRIKNLVLNYDLRDDETDGDSNFHYPLLQPNLNRKHTETAEGLDKTHNLYTQPRLDKAGNNRSNQRARKLQLSDVNWYGKNYSSSQSRTQFQSQVSLSDNKPLATGSTVSERRDFLSSHTSQGPRREGPPVHPTSRRIYK